MANPKIYKIIAALAIGFGLTSVVLYASLKPRYKAIVKTVFLHETGIIDNKWEFNDSVESFKILSPAFLIDDIYKSMEGPKSSRYIQLSADTSVVWITGFEVKAFDPKTGNRISNDFICHTNIDINDVKYYSDFGLEDRIGKQYPRLTSLSHGLETFRFPKGYGVPIRGNDYLFVTTESLNHNLKDTTFLLKHQVTIEYKKKAALKPLMSRTAFIQLPYDKSDPFKGPTDPGSNVCLPVETRNHSYDDGKGNKLSGHWVVPKGESSYRSNIDDHLQIKDSLRLHAAAIHVHPFATKITLFDSTEDKIIFSSVIINHKDRIGLEKVEDFVSEQGIWLYADHKYELVLDVNNTTNIDQDMMGSMFLFFYDRELAKRLGKQQINLLSKAN